MMKLPTIVAATGVALVGRTGADVEGAGVATVVEEPALEAVVDGESDFDDVDVDDDDVDDDAVHDDAVEDVSPGDDVDDDVKGDDVEDEDVEGAVAEDVVEASVVLGVVVAEVPPETHVGRVPFKDKSAWQVRVVADPEKPWAQRTSHVCPTIVPLQLLLGSYCWPVGKP